MRTYQCHKIVKAVKCDEIKYGPDTHDLTRLIANDGMAYAVPANIFAGNEPQGAFYIVEYEDGYRSWSPSEAFEKGYSELKEDRMPIPAEAIARVCHEANKAYCLAIGDDSQVSWEGAPQWQKDSAVVGVNFCLTNPFAPPSANHDSWLKQKEAEGWKYGPVKDADKKEHPCYVPYDELPEEQKKKDALFKAVVAALS